MKLNLATLRWVALFGLAALVLHDLYASFPLRPRQGYGIVLLALMMVAVGVVSLVLMPRAVSLLARRLDLLIPLALVILAGRLLGWLAGLPILGALLSPSLPLRLSSLSFSFSLHFVLSIALAVAYATWMTAAILALVRMDQRDPCAVVPVAFTRYWRVLGTESIGWVVVFVGLATLLPLMGVLGFFALVPMALLAAGWNFATAAILPVAFESTQGFWLTFRDGVSVSLSNLKKWWPLLLAQMILLGMFIFYYARWSEGTNHHASVNWNVNTFWTGGYENECRWYGKLTEAYKTSKLPLVETLLALLFGAMAVAIKITVVQRMQPETSPPVSAPPGTAPPMTG